ncbi:hypothetical protein KSP40_PGU017366 [Platanthera guangdongensis]|uniref:Uncharacterized protein n=1 Tax=Platanthera guangdongensis TaxID=2320717 RepID=A0ABR2N1I6_9ASPA
MERKYAISPFCEGRLKLAFGSLEPSNSTATSATAGLKDEAILHGQRLPLPSSANKDDDRRSTALPNGAHEGWNRRRPPPGHRLACIGHR